MPSFRIQSKRLPSLLLGVLFLPSCLSWIACRSQINHQYHSLVSHRTSSSFARWGRRGETLYHVPSCRYLLQPSRPQQRSAASSTTCLQMAYNRGNNNGPGGAGDLVNQVGGLLLLVAFFASPLGGIFFGLLNSMLFVTLFVIPVAGFAAFNAWRYFNVLEGPCPSCGVPATVIKAKENEGDRPSPCFNCGAILQASYDNKEILNVSGKRGVDDSNNYVNTGGGGSIFDIFGNGGGVGGATTTTSSGTATTGGNGPKVQKPPEQTILDAEIETKEEGDDSDALPFQ